MKGGKFPNSHVAGNKALIDKGISCSKSLDRSDRKKKNLEERIKKEVKQ